MQNNLSAKSTILIAASISKVWDALINPEIIKQYLFGSEVISDWKVGSSVIYKGNYQGKIFNDKGNVVQIEPEKILVLTHWSPLSGTNDAPENYHTVTYELHVADGGVAISITQDNCSSEEEQKQNGQFWGMVLREMKKLLEAST